VIKRSTDNHTNGVTDSSRSIRFWIVATSVLAGSLVVGIRFFRSPDLNALITKAYTENRTIELRIPGAAHSRLRTERGAGRAHSTKPATLLEAELLLTRYSPKHRADPDWLRDQARASLLEWDYESAIREINNALMLKPDDAELLVDRATAYFERAEMLGPMGAIDYGGAAEDISKVLKQNPEDEIALYNRGIIFEKLYLPNEAIADFERYLKIDPKGDWAAEAKERLERLVALVRTHEDALHEPLADPAAFIHLTHTAEGAAKLDKRIEDYQDLAIRSWLSAAFPVGKLDEHRDDTFAALQALARLLENKHQDHWLADLLAGSSASGFALAVSDFVRSVRLSAAGDPINAGIEAVKAEKRFEALANRAGVTRSRLEQVYAFQRSRNARRCLSASGSEAVTLHASGYPWAEIQLKIEQSACSMMVEHFDEARSYIAAAQAAAASSHYPVLHLRALGIGASIETDSGNITSAWEKDVQGLSAYWGEVSAPPMRGHQFADDLMYSAEDLEQWHLAVNLARESTAFISSTDDRSAEALDRQHLVTLAIRAGEFDIADAELRRANAIRPPFAEGNAFVAYKLFSEIDRAQIELESGLTSEAERRLQATEPGLADVSSFDIPLSFYSVYGSVLQKQGKVSAARLAFQKAIRVAAAAPEFLANGSNRYLWLQELSRVYRALTQIEAMKGDAEASLVTWENFRALTITPSSKPFVLTIDDVRKKLATLQGKTLLVYAVLPDGLAAWICDEHGVQLRFMKTDTISILRLAEYFIDICADPRSDVSLLQNAGLRLHNIFISPLAERLDKTRLLAIDSDDDLGNMPYEAFWDGRHYLASSYQIVLEPGAELGSERKVGPSLSADSHALVVGSTATIVSDDTSLLPAPEVVREAKSVAQRFPNADLLIGAAATRSSVEALLPKAELFHYVGHALADARHEGLLLFSSRKEHRSEIWSASNAKTNLFRNCRLAVLSACSTGKGNRGRREIHGEMLRAMLRAGIPHVIATRWDVDSAATETYMEAFYAAVSSGKTISDAANLAATTLFNHPQMQHPYYWAAFGVYEQD
jgi:CHAT domain-containing protein